ncbi:MAG: lipoate--protein ligase [Clostridiaceae bacterium]|nr:lipoate--protein ligase [Clostridiaceae bacterium]
MITHLRVVCGDGYDPYRNLAAEQVLLESVEEGECILYLWQNRQTVVIGRNQNAWLECRLSELEQDGGRLARRLSGGGAVYHDLGNLNFTFLVRKADYDLDRQLDVVIKACQKLGISAKKSGRNDVLADDRKFSGNAFYDSGGHAYHHGTLLVDVDMDALSRYLRPSRAKLEAKGVQSVRSRVVNLRELQPGLTIQSLKEAMISAFELVYDLPSTPLTIAALDGTRLAALTARNESWEWRLGPRLPFTCACEGRFLWGGLSLELQVGGGVIENAKVWSDAMDWQFAGQLEDALRGARFAPEALRARLSQSPLSSEIRDGALQLLANQAF